MSSATHILNNDSDQSQLLYGSCDIQAIDLSCNYIPGNTIPVSSEACNNHESTQLLHTVYDQQHTRPIM